MSESTVVQRTEGRDWRAGQAGFSMVEVVVAIGLLAAMAVGFARTTGSSLELTGAAKERQTATQLATTAIEEARAVPYAGLGLPLATTFEGAATPDAGVAGTTYTTSIGGEQLVLLATGGLPHRDGTEISGVDYQVYRYVTWLVDGPNTTAAKRVTAVVVHPGSAHNGTGDVVTLSTIISSEAIGFSSTSSTSTPATTTTTTTPATTTTIAPGACGGDTTPPTSSISILAGIGADQGYTGSASVSLSLTAGDPCGPITMQLSNSGSGYSPAEPFSGSKVWTLATGDGDKTIWFKATDGAGNTSVKTAQIRLDSTKPSKPGSFALTPSTSPRKVTITWGRSTDNDRLIGYRVFKKINTSTFVSLAGTQTCASTCSIVDNDVKSKTTYTYYVVAYDAAGNQSDETTKLSQTF